MNTDNNLAETKRRLVQQFRRRLRRMMGQVMIAPEDRRRLRKVGRPWPSWVERGRRHRSYAYKQAKGIR